MKQIKKKRTRKSSQILSVDLIVALGVFIALFLFIIITWNTNTLRIQNIQQDIELHQIAYHASSALRNTQGIPTNWQTNITTTQAIGLSSSFGVLSRDKIDTLIDHNDTHYQVIKEKLGILGPGYEMHLEFYQYNGTEYASIGDVGIQPNSNKVIRTERFATLEDKWAKIVMFIWVRS